MSGRPFSGHTEYIAALCGATESRMLLASERLCTVHVSTHVALRAACDLNTGRIVRTIELGYDAMRLLGFERPRIAVCGLNPHAGEHGLFGPEDESLIAPAVEAARAKGIACSGPHAGDTIFLQASRGAYDLVVAMYHDQGHIPMKLIDFEGTVNAATVAGHNGSGALRCLDTYDRPQYDWRSCSWSARRRKRVAGEER
jgi:4-hydroxythreonine-4-phosphate dehydrogenase